ncbi:nucleotidyltransferase [Paenibacillus sp. sgz500958]|uniref:nucleotidyltransferase n=1 Tax=Paenibacillus sp. sgz500958 TaxID=3242475 RepID=UPI0036D2FAE4
MGRTVITAFNDFQKNIVNLDSGKTKTARLSRDWLLGQISQFPSRDHNFPKLYEEKNVFFGSFSKRTKIRELDDIDLMVALSAEEGYYADHGNYIAIHVKEEKLGLLCNNDTDILNSKKVINKIISQLNQVSQYDSADMKRNQEAATLKLKSYTWNFDIVPCFFTKKDAYDKDYYLIPDGNGNWKKTDPRIDSKRTSEVNQYHDGNVLNVIRIIKYWNKRPVMPSMSSYLLENMILNYYIQNQYNKASQYVDLEIIKIFQYLSSQMFNSVSDPKGIQGELNNLSFDDKIKISTRAKLDYQKAVEARDYEEKGDHVNSIKKWKEVLGQSFY